MYERVLFLERKIKGNMRRPTNGHRGLGTGWRSVAALREASSMCPWDPVSSSQIAGSQRTPTMSTLLSHFPHFLQMGPTTTDSSVCSICKIRCWNLGNGAGRERRHRGENDSPRALRARLVPGTPAHTPALTPRSSGHPRPARGPALGGACMH